MVEALEDALSAGSLPLQRESRRGGRPRLAFGAPLPLGMAVDRELFDLWLLERRPLSEVRATVSAALPAGYRLEDAHDMWLGSPALPASVVGAEYVVAVATDADEGDLREAVSRLLASTHLPRERAKGSGTAVYDLRPLVAELDVRRSEGGSVDLRAVVRFHPALGSGRPEELVAALAGMMDHSLEVAGTRRSRLILADDPDQG